ncbi:MAG: hypothetical protein ABIT38_10020 [Gemmatimonadaceae bacterium]
MTVIIDGQRFTGSDDLLQLEGLLGLQDIAYVIFLPPNEAGVLYASETTDGMLVIARKGTR